MEILFICSIFHDVEDGPKAHQENHDLLSLNAHNQSFFYNFFWGGVQPVKLFVSKVRRRLFKWSER